MKKREFLITGAGAVAAGSALAGAGTGPAATAGDSPVASDIGRGLARPPELQGAVGPQAWEAYVQDRFRVRTEAGEVELVLGDVRSHAVDAAGAQFSLYFTAAAGAPGLAARTHELRHATGQRVAVYVVPAGADAQARPLYRADFNQLA